MPWHTVQQGESVIALSERYGHFAETIWNRPENAELRQKRKDMNVLAPGDAVFIPEIEPKEVSRATDRTHRFRRKGVPAVLHLQLFDGETPRANQAYEISVNGRTRRGTTDEDGVLHETIPAQATQGVLSLADGVTYQLRFGHLDPIDSIAGVQQRLNNLGYACGANDGEMSDRLRSALGRFQRRFALPESFEPDAATLAKLEELHDTPAEFPDEAPP